MQCDVPYRIRGDCTLEAYSKDGLWLGNRFNNKIVVFVWYKARRTNEQLD